MAQGYAGYSAVDRHEIRIRQITSRDVTASLREGLSDFMEQPSHLLFLCLVYPVMGVVIGVWTSGQGLVPLVFPLVSGFALVGPLAAVGLYEISRRRERGLDTSLRHAFAVPRSGAFWSIAGMGLVLAGLFLGWLFAAQGIYAELFAGTPAHGSVGSLFGDVFGTRAGWTLLIVGHAVGFMFAAVVLAVSVVSLPLLLDADGEVGLWEAMSASVRATWLNAGPVFFFGFVVALTMMLGSAPLFVGLAVVLPVLGHATWRLYRRLIVLPGSSPAAARRQ